MRTRRPRVNDTLGNTLMIEMGDLFAKDEIFQKRRAARIGPERILIVGNGDALVRGERGVLSTSDLVQLAAGRRSHVRARGRFVLPFLLFSMTRCLFLAHDQSPSVCSCGFGTPDPCRLAYTQVYSAPNRKIC